MNSVFSFLYVPMCFFLYVNEKNNLIKKKRKQYIYTDMINDEFIGYKCAYMLEGSDIRSSTK